MTEHTLAIDVEEETDDELMPEASPATRRPRSSPRARRPGGARPRGAGRVRAPKQCAFCVSKVADVNYKQVDVLLSYVTDRGKIRPRRQTGLCAKHQRGMARAIKRARYLALLPFTTAGYGRFPR